MAQPGFAVVGGVVWPRPVYVPYAASPYPVPYAPWGLCAPQPCVDPVQVQRYVARELRLQALRSEDRTSFPSGFGFARPGESPYAVPRSVPPVTPDSEIQPAYRGAGELRPEFQGAGQILRGAGE
ncbi:MAG: hypothetical protein N2544_16040 [Burkholderiales bacterium]|nr:hypothetical protein [Burkholderiales bacterium]